MIAFVAALALASAPAPVKLSTSILDDTGLFRPTGGWRVKTGDDPRWREVGFDDSSWESVRAPFPPSDWETGIAWFRLEVELDETLSGKAIALWTASLGAFETYVDGLLVATNGDFAEVERTGVTPVQPFPLEPVILRLEAPGRHLLAFRALNPRAGWISRWGWPFPGCWPIFGDTEKSLVSMPDRLMRSREVRAVFSGAAFVLGFVHLLLFGFRKGRRGNVDFAIGAIAIAAVAFADYRSSLAKTSTEMIPLGVIFRLGINVTSVALLHFYHSAFGKVSKLFYAYAAVGAALAAAVMYVPLTWVFVFSMIGLFESLRVMILAVVRRAEGAWIVGAGAFVSIGLAVLQMVISLFGWMDDGFDNTYLYGFFAMLVTMAIYLARTFAKNERELAEHAVKLEAAEQREQVLRELEAVNKRLHETQAQLVHSEKMASLGSLVAGVAHELNTPIGAIKSTGDLLERGLAKLREVLPAGDAKAARMLESLEAAVKVVVTGSARVSEIVKRLKSFARLDQAVMQRADLNACIQDAVALSRHELGDRITLELELGAIPELVCAPGELNQVFLNLLVNAAQAIEGPGRIKVRSTADEGWVRVSVEDSGLGIAPEILPKIFDPGFTTKGVKVGTGLGLAISYRIVETHKGRITVESEVGKGSTFTVHVPRNLEA